MLSPNASHVRNVGRIQHIQEEIVKWRVLGIHEVAIALDGPLAPPASTIGRSSCVWIFDSLMLLPKSTSE